LPLGLRRVVAVGRQILTNREYAKALLEAMFNRLPLGLRRVVAVGRQTLTNREYAKALLGVGVDRLIISHVRNYTFSSEEERAFALILAKLQLSVPPCRVLTQLKKRMTLDELNRLSALLNHVHSNTAIRAENAQSPAVVNAADLEPEECLPNRRYKILFITGEFPNLMHGGGGRLVDFIKIISQEHDVYLYSWFGGHQFPGAEEALAAYCKKIERVNYREFEGSLERLDKFIGNVNIDIVHYEWPRSLTNYHPAWGKHHIFTFMEAISLRLAMDMASQRPLSSRWYNALIELLNALQVEVVSAAKANAHIVVTRKDGEFLGRFTPERQYVVLNHGVSLDQFCLPDQAPENHALVFVGNFLHYPNEDAVRFFFGRIFGQIKDRVPDVKVYLVGANPTSRVKRYHDSRHVFVTGAVDDIRPYIQRAAVCIAPLISGAGLRSKVIQYAALRRACVATSIAATDLLFEDSKDIFIADDPRVFAQRVLYLLERPDAARQMAESAFEQVQKYYDNRKLVGDLYRVYESLENSQSPRRNANTGNT